MTLAALILTASLMLFVAGMQLSAFFSGSETGFYRVSQLQLTLQKQLGDPTDRLCRKTGVVRRHNTSRKQRGKLSHHAGDRAVRCRGQWPFRTVRWCGDYGHSDPRPGGLRVWRAHTQEPVLSGPTVTVYTAEV